MWYTVLRFLSVGGRGVGGGAAAHAVNHNLVLLMMGIVLPETCWAILKINKLLLLHLVGPLLYRRCTVKHTSDTNMCSLLLSMITNLLTYSYKLTYLLTYFIYILTYLHSYILTYLLTYILTYILTYLLTFLLTCILTSLHTYLLTFLHT